jgi:hypothetical protein
MSDPLITSFYYATNNALSDVSFTRKVFICPSIVQIQMQNGNVGELVRMMTQDSDRTPPRVSHVVCHERGAQMTKYVDVSKREIILDRIFEDGNLPTTSCVDIEVGKCDWGPLTSSGRVTLMQWYDGEYYPESHSDSLGYSWTSEGDANSGHWFKCVLWDDLTLDSMLHQLLL